MTLYDDFKSLKSTLVTWSHNGRAKTLHADACYSTIRTMMATMMIMMITMMMMRRRRRMKMNNGFTNRGMPVSPLSRTTP